MGGNTIYFFNELDVCLMVPFCYFRLWKSELINKLPHLMFLLGLMLAAHRLLLYDLLYNDTV